MSNPYAQEILGSIAQRVGAERLIVADQWIRDRLVEIGDGVGASAMNLVGSPAEHRWMVEPGTTLDAIRRLMDGSAESVFHLQQPAKWLLRSLFWALSEPSLSPMWLEDDLIRWEPNDPRLIAKALFAENSTSRAILLEHLDARDPVADRMALLGGALWSLSMLSVWTPDLLAHFDHLDRLAIQPMPRDLAVAMLADLRADFLGSSRMEQIRAISRRRQGRGRDGQGTEEE